MSLNTILATTPLTSTGYHLKATGTTIGNSLIWDNGTNVGIGNTNTSYTLDVSGTFRTTGNAILASSGGNVGIGTASPSSYAGYTTITIDGTSGGEIDFKQSGTLKGDIFANSTGFFIESITAIPLIFSTNATEKMRITSTGNVGIGVTPNTWFTSGGYKVLQIGAGMSLDSGNDFRARIASNAYVNTSGDWIYSNTGFATNYSQTSGQHIWQTAPSGTSGNAITFTDRMTITSGGGVGIGTTSVTGTTKLRAISVGAVQGDPLFFSDNGVYNSIGLYAAGADGYNGAACVMIMGKNTNNRTINAGGTINASGNDYAEYMTKAIEDNIAKGDVVGVNENGLLTNIFINAKSFVVKSTDPSYVGGDTWGNVDIIGKLPLEATDEEKAEYEAKLEVARAKVDRIAFSGQVPCNVYNANVGDYIIPIDDNGKIKGEAITNPTFEQYQLSVGKVWKIMEDGRAWIAVKIG